jgi:hypothetical protein
MTNKHGTDIAKTLAEREVQHGPFATHAKIENQLAEVARGHTNCMTDVQRVGLSMIMHKIARILNRGHNHSDTWHDIAGYATLVEKSILDE